MLAAPCSSGLRDVEHVHSLHFLEPKTHVNRVCAFTRAISAASGRDHTGLRLLLFLLVAPSSLHAHHYHRQHFALSRRNPSSLRQNNVKMSDNVSSSGDENNNTIDGKNNPADHDAPASPRSEAVNQPGPEIWGLTKRVFPNIPQHTPRNDDHVPRGDPRAALRLPRQPKKPVPYMQAAIRAAAEGICILQPQFQIRPIY